MTTTTVQALSVLEGAIRNLDQLAGILLHLTTADEQGLSLYQALVNLEETVHAVKDSRLTALYQRLVEGHRNFMPQYKKVIEADYQAFMAQIVKLWTTAQVNANEADIEIRKRLGGDASNGIWGPSGWKPSLSAS
jgi:hypothetical protein